MLYSEFVEGTGCKQNDHNYQVYKNLEVMYMNSDMPKQEIYEYGKKLVDNSKTPEEIEIENGIKAEIKSTRDKIKKYQEEIKRYQSYSNDDGFWKDMIKSDKGIIKSYKREITRLKMLLL